MSVPCPDSELLTAFAGRANQAAFAELVQRHGPMVVRVAEAILRDRHGAEDVAQAAFLVLAQKAAGLRKSETIAPWLHRVSWRLAIDELRRRQSRQRREEENVRMNTPASPADLSAVHEELGTLPNRYRNALVLCDLDGEPQDSAARCLGLSAEALRKRLERARELLRKRLVRRGIAVGSVGALTTLLSTETRAAVLPATFVSATVKAAGLAAAGKLAVGVSAGTVSAHVAALTKGALNMLFWNTVKTAALTAVCVGVVGIGVVTAQRNTTSDAPAPTAQPRVDINPIWGELGGVADNGEVTLNVAVPAGNPSSQPAASLKVRIPAAAGREEAVRTAAAKFNPGERVKLFYVATGPGFANRRAVDVVAVGGSISPEVRAWAGQQLATKLGGELGQVFKPIDTTQSGTYGDGKWFYSYTITPSGPQKGYRQGFLRYGSADLMDPEPGAYILTPWGWMQWEDRPTRGNWLPVAEKPAKGKQLPNPATHPEIISRPPPSP
jgi:RNA polymerase sigma factor (sigma-70 family)